MQKIVLILLALVLTTGHAEAQKRRGKAARRTPKVELPAENPRFLAMLPSTQKVLVADSVVVDSAAFLSAIMVNREEGVLQKTLPAGLQSEGTVAVAWLDEMCTRCIFACETADSVMRLYMSDCIAGRWTEPEQLRGLDAMGFTHIGYPYMMPDGQTLFFAAKGGDGLGGYDIYRTRYDGETGSFLRPENLGLPFNSEQDDYMFVVSEQDSIGFFATSRHQYPGRVCVYTFVPTESRRVYEADEMGEAVLKQRARLTRIADTWFDKRARAEAIERCRRMKARLGSDGKDADDFAFVVNDATVYTRLADFRSQDNAVKFCELRSLQHEVRSLESSLARLRDDYALSDGNGRQRLAPLIVDGEQRLESLQEQAVRLEKAIRIAENRQP